MWLGVGEVIVAAAAVGIMEVRGLGGGGGSSKGERAKSEAPEAAGHDRQI